MSARQETTLIAGERIIYTIRRSRRAKNLLLHVDAEGSVEVVVPWGVAWQAAEKFVRDKHTWLEGHLHKRRYLRARAIGDGNTIPLFGEALTLEIVRSPQRRRAIVLRRQVMLTLHVPPGASVKRVLEAWYRRQARIFFTRVATEYATTLHVAVTTISIGKHRTQWGSCSATGRLSFNWRLLLGPEWIAQYVAVHEVAHLVHHNHSAQYWALVGKLFPQHREARHWLKEKAGELRW